MMPPLDLEELNRMAKLMPPPPPRFHVRTADQQMRTDRDVPDGQERIRPRPPSKLNGRRGTRKAWKRAHPPRWAPRFRYREPTDILVIDGRAMLTGLEPRWMMTPAAIWIVTPAQMRKIDEALRDLPPRYSERNPWL